MSTSTPSTSRIDRPYAAQVPIAERVVALVGAHPDGIGRTDIARALGVKTETVGSALSRAVVTGQVRRLDRGMYAPGEATETTTQEATDSRRTDAHRSDGIQIRLGRMGQQEGLLIAAGGGYGEAFIPREALPDLRRRLARAQAKIEASS